MFIKGCWVLLSGGRGRADIYFLVSNFLFSSFPFFIIMIFSSLFFFSQLLSSLFSTLLLAASAAAAAAAAAAAQNDIGRNCSCISYRDSRY